MSTKSTPQPVRPVSPIAAYIGGKRNLALRLVDRIEAVPHELYAEPFVGMGGVFFRRRRRPAAEAINDYSRDVATLFRVLQRHYPQFMEVMRFQLTSRAEFERLSRTDPTTLTDLEKAARFLYLQRTAFGGRVAGRNFGVSPQHGARFNLLRLATQLEDVHERLSGVVIECLPWRDFLARYDRPETLFYLDPPYWGSEDDYGKGAFLRTEFVELADALSGIRGRFILSINDRPETRAVFERFAMEAVETTYSVAGGADATKARELIVNGGAVGRHRIRRDDRPVNGRKRGA
jgi:DNA adenine methylase